MNESLVLSNGKEMRRANVKILDSPEKIRALSCRLSWEILSRMKNPKCPMDLSKEMGIHEQKIYYHIKKLNAAGLISETGKEARHGTIAKFYSATNDAICIMHPGVAMESICSASSRYNKSLEPFITEGKINFTIVVGSPDPHGPFRARAADAVCGIDLGLFLGSFSDGVEKENYKLDVEMRESDFKQNLIIIGGPAANMVSAKINNKMPIQILMRNERNIFSSISKKQYESDHCGFVLVADSPLAKGKKVMVIAGKRFQGTRASILFLIKKFDKIFEGNKFNKDVHARVVMGYDMDGDGVIDSAEILE